MAPELASEPQKGDIKARGCPQQPPRKVSVDPQKGSQAAPSRPPKNAKKLPNNIIYLINAQREDLEIPPLRVYEKCVEKTDVLSPGKHDFEELPGSPKYNQKS